MSILRLRRVSGWVVAPQLILLAALLMHFPPSPAHQENSPVARLATFDPGSECVLAPVPTNPLGKSLHAPAALHRVPDFSADAASFSYASFSAGVPPSSSILLVTLSTSSDL